MDTLAINSVTALLCTSSKFDLFFLSQRISNSIYNKKRFPGLIVRKNTPKGTFLVFQSGKIIIVGCDSVKDAECLSKKIVKTLNKISHQKIQQTSFSITNILGSASLPFTLNIAKIADESIGIKYQSYPGVFYPMKKHIKAAIIYSSGKITLLGGKSKNDLEAAVQFIQQNLYIYRKEQLFQEIISKKTIIHNKKDKKKKTNAQIYYSDEETEQLVL